jgi:hypothetical protein
MARAEYNRTFEVYWGVDGAGSGAFKGNILGRFVRDLEPLSQGEPLSNIEGYVTSDSVLPTAGVANFDSAAWTIFIATADRILIEEVSDIPLSVWFIKLVHTDVGVPYFRYFVGGTH